MHLEHCTPTAAPRPLSDARGVLHIHPGQEGQIKFQQSSEGEGPDRESLGAQHGRPARAEVGIFLSDYVKPFDQRFFHHGIFAHTATFDFTLRCSTYSFPF